MNIPAVASDLVQRVIAHKVEMLCLGSFCVLYVCFLLTLLPLTTIVLMHLMPIPLLVLCYDRCRAVKGQGLAVYLPARMQEYLFEKSLIDVLMVMWDTPRLVEYLKRLVYPFFVQMDRQEALSLFEELNPDIAAAMDAKGLIHVLPQTVQKVLVNETELRDPLFLMPMLKCRPLHNRTRSSLDLDKDGLANGLAGGRRRPGRVQTDIKEKKPGVRTELISSSGDITTPLIKSSDNLNTVISRLRHRIPTLEPIFGHILGNQFRQLMSLLSLRILTAGSLLALLGLLVQIAFSRRVRRWTGSAIKFGAFGGCLWVLVTCALSLIIKFLHTRVQDPGPKSPKDKFLHFPEDLKSGFTSRFEKEKRQTITPKLHNAFS